LKDKYGLQVKNYLRLQPTLDDFNHMDKTDKVKENNTKKKEKKKKQQQKTNKKKNKQKKQKQNTVMGHCPTMMLSNRAHVKNLNMNGPTATGMAKALE
jgi:hypothetical protein